MKKIVALTIILIVVLSGCTIQARKYIPGERFPPAPDEWVAVAKGYPCGSYLPVCIDRYGNKVTNDDLKWKVVGGIPWYCWPYNVKDPNRGCVWIEVYG